MTEEQASCFNGLTKLVAHHKDHKSGSEAMEEFAKLIRTEKYHQLENLYYENVQHRHKTAFTDILQRILFIQEVQTIQEYHIDGKVIKVHVIEDTEL